jgi:hypothetical protein
MIKVTIKKRVVMLDFGLLHHPEEIHCCQQAWLKGAAEEQMKCSFFNVVAA